MTDTNLRYFDDLSDPEQGALFESLINQGLLADDNEGFLRVTALGEEYIVSGSSNQETSFDLVTKNIDASGHLRVGIPDDTDEATINSLETMCRNVASALEAKGIPFGWEIRDEQHRIVRES